MKFILVILFIVSSATLVFADDKVSVIATYEFNLNPGTSFEEGRRLSLFVVKGVTDYIMLNGLGSSCNPFNEVYGQKYMKADNKISSTITSSILCADSDLNLNNKNAASDLNVSNKNAASDLNLNNKNAASDLNVNNKNLELKNLKVKNEVVSHFLDLSMQFSSYEDYLDEMDDSSNIMQKFLNRFNND